MVKVDKKAYYSDTQKGIIAFEDSGYGKVYSAKYGTYGEFKKLAEEGIMTNTSKGPVKVRFSKNHTMGMNDDWEGINYWIIAKGQRNAPDLTFFVFKEDGTNKPIVPTKKISQYFNLYEPFLRKKR